MEEEKRNILEYFRVIEDPRVSRNRKYPIEEVVVITILAVISFAKGWEDIERYGKTKYEWLKTFMKLEHGIPKHDVYRRVFTVLKPELIEECFMSWVQSVKKDIKQEVIAIDGKTVRGTFNAENNKALHIVSAYATDSKLVFGQVKTDEKSNEITAIPLLLDKLSLEGAIVSIDAMGCQYKIADKIVKKKADYLFSLKGNQETLHDDVKLYFKDFDFNKPASSMKDISFETTTTYEEKRGRKEERNYAVSGDVEWLRKLHPHFKTINSIGFVDSEREVKGKITKERRHFISSLPAEPHTFAKAVRSHWGIENSLHYVLDVSFGEDDCRITKAYAPENMTIIRKIALNIARLDTTSTSSMAGRIKQMAWDHTYLEKLLFYML